jgi:hypothetical protein
VIDIKLSGINLKLVKSFQEQDFDSKNQMSLNVIPKPNRIKDPSRPNRVSLNDSGLYEAVLLLSEVGKDICYDLFIAFLLQMIQDGNVSYSFKIGKRSVLEELEEEYERLSLENLCAEEEVKGIELKLKKILLEEELKRKEESQKQV